MKNMKAFQRDQLIYELGILLQPLENLMRATGTPSPAEYRIALAKVHAGDNEWRQRAYSYGLCLAGFAYVFLLRGLQLLAADLAESQNRLLCHRLSPLRGYPFPPPRVRPGKRYHPEGE